MATPDRASRSMTPNFTQYPNVLVDDYLKFLDHRAGESAVLTVLIRQTYGWQKAIAAVSTTYMARMTGLNRVTCAKAVDTLVAFGLAVKCRENDPAKNHGAYYTLQLDEDKIDLSGLQERRETVKSKRMGDPLGRMSAMRAAKPQKQGESPSDPAYDISNPLLTTQTAPLLTTQADKRKGKEKPNKAAATVPNLDALAVAAKMDKMPSAKIVKGNAKKAAAPSPFDLGDLENAPAIRAHRRVCGYQPMTVEVAGGIIASVNGTAETTWPEDLLRWTKGVRKSDGEPYRLDAYEKQVQFHLDAEVRRRNGAGKPTGPTVSDDIYASIKARIEATI